MDWKVEFRSFEGADSFVVATLDENGCLFYTIVINSNRDYITQRKAFYHEYDHLLKGDFERLQEVGLSVVEHEAHGV